MINIDGFAGRESAYSVIVGVKYNYIPNTDLLFVSKEACEKYTLKKFCWFGQVAVTTLTPKSNFGITSRIRIQEVVIFPLGKTAECLLKTDVIDIRPQLEQIWLLLRQSNILEDITYEILAKLLII